MRSNRPGHQVDLTTAELKKAILDIGRNEDKVETTVTVGERYLCGNFIVLEYASSLKAAEVWADMDDVDREVFHG